MCVCAFFVTSFVIGLCDFQYFWIILISVQRISDCFFSVFVFNAIIRSLNGWPKCKTVLHPKKKPGPSKVEERKREAAAICLFLGVRNRFIFVRWSAHDYVIATVDTEIFPTLLQHSALNCFSAYIFHSYYRATSHSKEEERKKTTQTMSKGDT